MPTYVYRRDEGTTFKTQQRITGQPGVRDPSTPTADDLPDLSCVGGRCGL